MGASATQCKEDRTAGLCLNSPSSGQAAMSLPPKPGPSSSQLLLSRSLGPLETQAQGTFLMSMNSSPRMYQVLFVPRNREAGEPPGDSLTKGVVEGRKKQTPVNGER